MTAPGAETLFVSRIARLPLLDATGAPLGRVEDVVVSPRRGTPPRVTGFVASVQRRRIFVNANRIGELGGDGLRLRSGTIDVRPFRKRPGELLAAEDLFDSPLGDETVYDIGIRPRPGPSAPVWEVVSVAFGPPRFVKRRRATRVAGWQEASALLPTDEVGGELSELRDLPASEAAAALLAMPLERQLRLARELDDETLAAMLEEMPEAEQVEILEAMSVERAADVIEEMDPDDAADVLAEMPAEDARRILSAMQPGEAEPLRRLMGYGAATAGGLMTPEPVILPATATVAEALALVREPGLAMAHAAQVFVVRPPLDTPTGPFLGVVGFQRLLREPPFVELGDCVDEDVQPITPDTPDRDVAERLAAYDLLAIPVCDEAGRLVGAVTVDDVIDHLLPEDWRDSR